jgi:hypothetical protein
MNLLAKFTQNYYKINSTPRSVYAGKVLISFLKTILNPASNNAQRGAFI